MKNLTLFEFICETCHAGFRLEYSRRVMWANKTFGDERKLRLPDVAAKELE